MISCYMLGFFHVLLLLPQCLGSHSLQHLTLSCCITGQAWVSFCLHTHTHIQTLLSVELAQLFIPHMADHLRCQTQIVYNCETAPDRIEKLGETDVCCSLLVGKLTLIHRIFAKPTTKRISSKNTWHKVYFPTSYGLSNYGVWEEPQF